MSAPAMPAGALAVAHAAKGFLDEAEGTHLY